MPRRSPIVEDSVVRIDGPWTHRDVSANGIRLHVAEAGDGPLVVLLHGFPQFWWMWRHQLTGLADAGYRAVAPDLRGYGASDKPPRGYDSVTLAADIAGLIRALGEREAVVVGHDWGGHLAWTLAAQHPRLVRKLVVLSIPHPLRWQAALARDPEQRAASRYIARFQLPWHPERWLVANDAENVARIIESWAGPAYPVETLDRWREAMLILGAPRARVLPVGGSVDAPDRRSTVPSRAAAATRRADPAAAGCAGPMRVAADSAGLESIPPCRLRMATARGRRALPGRRSAGPRHRGRRPLVQGLTTCRAA